MSPYPQPLARPLFILSLLFTAPTFAQNSSIYFGIDNDSIVTTDQDYTNGVFISYTNDFDISHDSIFNALPGTDFDASPNGDTLHRFNIELGQKMWTPKDIENPDPVPGERPYAGLLYLSSTLYAIKPDSINSYSLMFGTMGPNSYAEQGQKFVHSIIKSDDPQGWDNQISNQVVLNLNYQRNDKWYESSVSGSTTHELSTQGRIMAGNFRSELAGGAMWRWGSNLGSSFGSAKVNNESSIDPGLIIRSKSGWYLYSGLEGRFRFNDITIEGDRPDDGITASEVEHLQATVTAGVLGYYRGWGASLAVSTKTRDYREDPRSFHTNGSLALFWLF
ncbi:lipid A deacylase LpxR family protein [Vibrio gallicus]|uniref:lipid A deacylase LpxR family protein n=1 Tax=Vibrio gallicus TaxID=190897 RepID=UPI0021C40B4C|nr:lipid A deacylase LpxR family protein [Vibrio gallicus]